MAIGIGIGLPFRRNIATTPAVPSGLSASFTVDTISGDLTWTDNSAGKAQYEIYSSTNGGDYALLTTTSVGATSYSDTTCKQNASVVYRIRAKKGALYSDYVTAAALVTPLCWKTNQSIRTNVVINNLDIAAGKTVNIDWGDGTNANYTGSNANITKTYDASAVNIFNIKLSGDLNSITKIQHFNQTLSYGVVRNWILPPASIIQFSQLSISGDISCWVISATSTVVYLYSNLFTGSTLNIDNPTAALNLRLYSNRISACGTTTFRKAMTVFNIKDQNVSFPTVEIDKLLKALADWFEVNAPTANCTFDMSGVNMGIPTDGVSNVDIVRLIGYYSAAGFAATIICRTS